MRAMLSTLVVVLSFAGCATNSNGSGDDAAGDDQVGDDGGDAVACSAPDEGVGESCLVNDDCTCDTTCAARTCVAKSACDEARITWDAPISNVDGSCLTDLAGFKLKWGTTMGGPYDNVLDVGMPCVDTEPVLCGEDGSMAPMRECTALMSDLPDGPVYFVMTTYNTMGIESDPSGEATKTVTCP